MGSDRDDPRIDWAAREVGRAYFGAHSVVNAVVALSSARALNLVLLILVAYLLSHKCGVVLDCRSVAPELLLSQVIRAAGMCYYTFEHGCLREALQTKSSADSVGASSRPLTTLTHHITSVTV